MIFNILKKRLLHHNSWTTFKKTISLKAFCVRRIFALILLVSVFLFNIVSTHANTVFEEGVVALRHNDVNHSGKQHSEIIKGNSRKKKSDFHFGRPLETNYQLTPKLSIGAYLEIESEYEKNYDMDKNDPDDLWSLEPSISLGLSYNLTKKIASYINIEAIHFFIEDDEDKKNDKKELNLKLAYLEFNDHLIEGLSMKLGRQLLKDRREWLYDEELDALRGIFFQKSFYFDFAVGEKNSKDLIEEIIKEKVTKQKVTNYIFQTGYLGDNDKEFSLYSIVQDDRRDTRQNPIFFGLRINGTWIERLSYWIDAAYVGGKDKDLTISGFGFDIGGTYTWNTSLNPSLTLSVAYGSGDDDSSDDTDKNFIQTGYQDNETKFNGLTSIKYYGEVFDPELSNLQIYTIGFGIRPLSKLSIDFFSHYFRQNYAVDYLRDTDIDANPEGLDNEIGYEIDIAVGYKITKKIKATITTGYFLPGNAFLDDADPAMLIGCKLRFKF